jgi:hypothetical protein
MKKTALLLAILATFSWNRSEAQCSYAIELDGGSEFLYTPFNNYSFTNFTLECWINVPVYTSNVHYISIYQNAYLVLGDWSGGSFTTWADGLNPIDMGASSLIPTVNQWHHVAFVYDGTNQYLYIDGVLDQTDPTTGAVNLTTAFNQGMVIGARYTQGTQFITGLMDEVRVWTVARSQTDIQNSMNSPLTGAEAGLVAYYQFEDGPGSSTVTDVTGNGNTLTLNNMDPATDFVMNSPISSLSLSTTVNGSTITSDDAGMTYQWLDCDNSYAVIPGETNQSYTPAGGGNYAVEVTDGACTDTSACQWVCYPGDIQPDLAMLPDLIDDCSVAMPTAPTATNDCGLTVNGTPDVTFPMTSSGTVTWTFDDGFGNTTTQTQNVTVNLPGTGITQNGSLLSADELVAAYQWLDCDNNYAVIPGAVNQFYTVTVSGNYAVAVTKYGCTDTSECVMVDLASIDDNFLADELSLYPNPSNDGSFNVSFDGQLNKIEVLDVLGRKVFEIENSKNVESLGVLPGK